MTLPWRSPRTCTSMCLARGMYFSRKTAGLPKARPASLRASSSRSARSAAFVTTRMPRPPPPNAALMMSGKPRARRDFQRLRAVGDGIFRAGQDGHADFFGEGARGDLVAHQTQQFGARPDKRDAGVAAGLGEVRIFRKKSVAGMDEVHALFLRQRDDARDVEIRADRALARADEIGFIRLEAMDGEAVFLGVDGDGAQAEFRGGAKDADGDFAAVGDEQFFQRCARRGGRGCGCGGQAHSIARCYRRQAEDGKTRLHRGPGTRFQNWVQIIIGQERNGCFIGRVKEVGVGSSNAECGIWSAEYGMLRTECHSASGAGRVFQTHSFARKKIAMI